LNYSEFPTMSSPTKKETLKKETPKKETPKNDAISFIEMAFIGSAKIAVPKAMTVPPMCDVIAQLTMSPAFLKRKDIVDNDVDETNMNKQFIMDTCDN